LIEGSARGNWENLGIMAAACGVTVTGLLLMKQMAPRILLLGALLWVALAGIGASSAASGRRARAALLGLGLGIAVIASYWLRWSVRFIRPDEWDFLCFYLNGPVAAHGLNFYDRGVFAEVFRQISIPYAPSRGFVNGYLNITFPYPPPTIFLFMPLGYLDYASANILWLGFVLLTFVLCVYVAYRVFLSPYGMNGLVLAAALLLVLPMTSRVFRYEQTTFLLFEPP
jgi:hypothetical protein